VAALTLWMVCTAPASARVYTFTKVADSAPDGFDPFSFECSAINNGGDIAFRTARAPGAGVSSFRASIARTPMAGN